MRLVTHFPILIQRTNKYRDSTEHVEQWDKGSGEYPYSFHADPPICFVAQISMHKQVLKGCS